MTETPLPILDMDVLDALEASLRGDREFVAELVTTYLDEEAAHVAAVQAAVAAGDAAALIRPAHTLKTTSMTFGAMRLAAVAKSLETQGRSGLTDRAAAEADAVGAEWAAAAAALRAWLDAPR